MEDLVGNLELYLQASVVMAFVAAFLGGVLASFTPCVYPMIPITSGYVGSRNLGGSKSRGFVLSLFYVLGIFMIGLGEYFLIRMGTLMI